MYISRKETIEDIILSHSQRGMHILQQYLQSDYCKQAAQCILNQKKGYIFLTTGFYVNGFAETDGPLGTMAIAIALKKLGYTPIIITDIYCKGFFEIKNLSVEYVALDATNQYFDNLLMQYKPVCMISIERCGKNIHDDYTNMLGISIKKNTAPLDYLFLKASSLNIPTIGIGDGGNEIGMGNLQDIIIDSLFFIPCKIKVDYLIIATVSNWGAYALIAYLSILTNKYLLPYFDDVEQYLKDIVDIGSVDGILKKPILSVDGFSLDIEKNILNRLNDGIYYSH